MSYVIAPTEKRWSATRQKGNGSQARRRKKPAADFPRGRSVSDIVVWDGKAIMPLLLALQNAQTLLESLGYFEGEQVHDDLQRAIKVLREKHWRVGMSKVTTA